MSAHPLTRWIKNLVGNRGTVWRPDGRPRAGAARPAPAPRWRPAIEALEDRTTPTLGLTTSTQMVVASDYNSGGVYAFDGQTGALLQTLVAPVTSGLVQPSGTAVGPDGNLYFSSDYSNAITEYSFRTQSLSTFIPASVLDSFSPPDDDSADPHGETLVFGPDGNLYVDFDGGPYTAPGGGVVRLGITNSGGALSFNGAATAVATGLTHPTGMTFGTGGDPDSLYVSNSGAGTVVRIAGATGGAPNTSTFIAAGSGGLEYPVGLTWGPDGDLFVTDVGAAPAFAGQVLAYTATGSFDRVFAQSQNSQNDQTPTGAVFLPDGDLLTTCLTVIASPPASDPTLLVSIANGSISEFAPNGTFARTFSAGAFPFQPGSGANNFSPTQIVLDTVPPPSGSTMTLSAGTVNGTYDQTITATGGTGTVTLAVSNVSNPIAGLTLPSGGTNSLAVTGTPMAPGTETFTVTATDGSGATTTINYSITAGYSPSVSVAYGPGGQVLEVIDSTGVLTQYDAAGAHALAGGVLSASVAFGPSGEVLVVTFQSGALVQYDATGAHALVGGVANASVAFGPSGEVLFVTYQDGTLVEYDATGAHPLVGGVLNASVTFGPSGEVVLVTYQGGTLMQYDATGAHTLTSNVASASVAFEPSGEELYVLYGDGSLVSYDARGTHAIGVA